MPLLINSLNNNPAIHSLPRELPAPTHTLSASDFFSKAIDIVKIGAAKGQVDQISVPLQVLRKEYAGEAISPATCRALIEAIKGLDVYAQHLPTIYLHLIVDLQLEVDDFSLCNEEFRIAKARLAAQQDGLELSQHIQEYGITSQRALIKIAVFAALQSGDGVSQYIQNYGIKSETALIEIAKLAAQRNGEGVSQYIQNYGIKSEAALVEIAKLAAQQSGDGVSQYIQNYGITSQETLIEIAKLAAQQSGRGVSENIQNYGIKSETALIEIAKLALQQNSPGASENIQNYGIKSQTALIEIARFVAQQDGQAVSQFIQNYGIKDEETLIEIAKLAAQQDGLGVSEYIQNYGIKSEAVLIEIAKLETQQRGWFVSQFIQNYGIKSETVLIEIAKLAAQQSGEGVSEYIQNYGIKSETALIEIAKLAAQQSGEGVSKYIQNYGIKSETALIEIAKLAAQQNGEGVSQYIQNYDIKSETALVEIAKLAAQQSGLGVSKYIQNYGIKSETALVEIAKLAAQQNGSSLINYIKKYGIKSETALIEIALLAIQQSPTLDLHYLLIRLNLSTKNTIFLISLLVNARNEIAQNMKDYFPQTDLMALLKQYPELRIFGVLNDGPDSELPYLSEMFDVTDAFSERRKTLYRAILNEENPALIAAKKNSLYLLCSIVDFAQGSPSLLNKLIALFDSVQQETNGQVQEHKLSLIASLLLHCRAKNVDLRAVDEQFFLLKEIFDLRDPLLCSYLSHACIENGTNPALCDFVKKHASKKLSADLVLIMLAPFIDKMDFSYVELCFAAQKNKISEMDPEIRFVPFIDRMKEMLQHKFFKDKTKTQTLLRNLRTLIDTPQLSHAEKTSVLRDLIFVGHPITIKDNLKEEQCKHLLRSAEAVALIIQCNQANSLMSINSEELHNQFNQLFKSALKIDAPDNLIFSTLAKWRKPGSLLMYAGKLQSSAETREKVLPHLQQFAKSVINNTFASDRYDRSQASEHWLKALETMPLEQIEKWKKGSAYVDNEFDVVDTDNPCDLLLSGTEVESCQKVNGDILNSKCLVAYLVDPKIRMMAVKNKQGVIIARCMLRLLWDKKAEKFVLFQEKKYSAGGNLSLEKILDRACKKRAEELGLALLSKDPEAQGSEETTLQAFKGKAPFEYVDALRFSAIQTDAGYEISNCTYIYQPVS